MMSELRNRGQSQPLRAELKTAEDFEDLSRTAAGEIFQQISSTLQIKTHFTMVLSGGSTPAALYALLADKVFVGQRLPWENLHFFWGDERHVAPDDPQSNYYMAHKTLLSKAPVPASNIHRVRAEAADAAKVAREYERELRSFFQLKTGQIPCFDCVLLGMGADGHTASLFPGSPALQENQHLMAANWVEQFQAFRFTLTVPVLNNAGCVIFLVSGEEKAETLKQVLEGDYRPDRLPAQLIRPVHGKLIWIVDRAAAGCLTPAATRVG
jgi:6-phosphogluconolactonase